MTKKMKVYFIGIGGASMSALAVLCKQFGMESFGSDDFQTPYQKILYENNIKFSVCPENGDVSSADLVVYSSAIPKKHRDLIKARKLGKKIIERAQFLAEIMSKYSTPIAVSGSHGKSTTTAMLYSCLRECNLNPALHLGALLGDGQTNVDAGKNNNYFVCESCEYKRNFRYLNPKFAIVLNIDLDHPDCFKDINDVRAAFQDFSNRSEILICHESVADFLTHKTKYVFGENEKCAFYCKNTQIKPAEISFDFYAFGKFIQNVRLKTYNSTNLQNALATLSVLYLINGNLNGSNALSTFCGINRRFEILPSKNENIFAISDYAHHPTELKSAISQFEKVADCKKIIIFQPHTYSRTKTLLNDFCKVLSGTESDVVIFKTYAAREKFDNDGDALTLASAIVKNGKRAAYMENFDEISYFLRKKLKEHKKIAVLLLGAGDIDDYRETLINLKENQV